VATFYNLIFRQPVGRHVILICDTVSCYVMGYEALLAHIEQRLSISLGQTTADGQFTLLPVPCLGACDHAPVLMIDDDLHLDVDGQKLDSILERYE
jgi:NADH-quinone oxidoreductase subunit E